MIYKYDNTQIDNLHKFFFYIWYYLQN